MIEIKANSENGLNAHIEMHGSMVDIVSELSFAVNRMYCSFCRRDNVIGESFRYMMTYIVTVDDSPLWKRNDIPGLTAVLMTENAGEKENPGQEEDS